MNNDAKVNRSYRSTIRNEGARATERSVVEAAGRLFVRNGFAATSIDAVAREAGVARATVFNAVGGKPALLQAAYHAAVVGGDDPRPASEGPLGERARRAQTPGDVLEVYAQVLTEVFQAVAPIHEALVTAAHQSAELHDLLSQLNQDRHAGATSIATLAIERGGLAPDISKERAADILWVYNDPHIWLALHRERGWSPEAFTPWLTSTLQLQLLGTSTAHIG